MSVRLERWAAGDLPLLTALLGDPAMTEHLGGPETPEKLAERQARYERTPTSFKIVDGEPVGWVGYWPSDDDVYETGWSVLPAQQGKGYATAGMRLVLELIRAAGDRRYVEAYPAVGNAPSNAVCRKLGFALLRVESIEYPKGHHMECNVWQFDLDA